MHLLALHIYITYIHFILHIISQQDTGMEYNHVNIIFFVRMVLFSLYIVVLAQKIFCANLMFVICSHLIRTCSVH